MRDFLIGRMQQMLLAAEEDGDDWILEMQRERARILIEDINKCLPSRFRRPPPGDAEPFGAHRTPEEIWRAIAGQLAAALLRKEPG